MNSLPNYDLWIYNINIKNYTEMPNCIRDSLKKVIYNLNNIPFDDKNIAHLKWDDKLHYDIEKYLHKINKSSYEDSTYLFAKHLVFINKYNKLHEKIRNEIYNRRLEDNNIISDDEECEYDEYESPDPEL